MGKGALLSLAIDPRTDLRVHPKLPTVVCDLRIGRRRDGRPTIGGRGRRIGRDSVQAVQLDWERDLWGIFGMISLARVSPVLLTAVHASGKRVACSYVFARITGEEYILAGERRRARGKDKRNGARDTGSLPTGRRKTRMVRKVGRNMATV